jgi:hypothetical protein
MQSSRRPPVSDITIDTSGKSGAFFQYSEIPHAPIAALPAGAASAMAAENPHPD